MIDMAYTAAEKKEEAAEGCDISRSNYPWGLEIRLEGDSLEKLGIDQLPAVGEILNINALCKVTSVSQSANEGDEDDRRCVTLQITSMDIGQGKSDKGNPPAPKQAKSILSYYSGGTGDD